MSPNTNWIESIEPTPDVKYQPLVSYYNGFACDKSPVVAGYCFYISISRLPTHTDTQRVRSVWFVFFKIAKIFRLQQYLFRRFSSVFYNIFFLGMKINELINETVCADRNPIKSEQHLSKQSTEVLHSVACYACGIVDSTACIKL